MELRGKKTNGYPGLFLDQIITTVVMRCVKTVTATNKFTLMKAGIGAAGDQIGQGLKKGAVGAVTGVGKGLLNVNQTRGVKVNARLRGVEAAAEALKVTIHQARHITSDRAKPAAHGGRAEIFFSERKSYFSQPPRNIRVVAAAPPRPAPVPIAAATAEYPRRGRGAVATVLGGISPQVQ